MLMLIHDKGRMGGLRFKLDPEGEFINNDLYLSTPQTRTCFLPRIVYSGSAGYVPCCVNVFYVYIQMPFFTHDTFFVFLQENYD